MAGSSDEKEASPTVAPDVTLTESGDKSTSVEELPKLASSAKRGRDDEEDNDATENKATETVAEVRDVNGAPVSNPEEGSHDEDNIPSSKRRKSENTSTSVNDESSTSLTLPSAEIESASHRETTAELEAEANKVTSIPKNINLADLPNEFPDSEDETPVDSSGTVEAEKNKDEAEEVKTPVPSQPSTPSSFVSASTTFTGGFGSFVKSGFGATPKTNIFGTSSSAIKTKEINSSSKEDEAPSVGTPSIFKTTGFSSFSTSGFQTPKKDNPWAESQETPKTAVKSMFSGESKSTSAETESSETSEKTAEDSDDLYVQLATPLSERKVETGEEAEESRFSCRAKLYVLNLTQSEQGWKERGVGTLHVNTKKTEGDASETAKSRMVMRSDGLLRVVLNVPLLKNFEVMSGMKSSLQSEKFVRISAIEDGKPVQYALRTNNTDTAKRLYKAIQDLVPPNETN